MRAFRPALPLLLTVLACGGPKGSELFASNGLTTAAGSDTGGSSSGTAGTGSVAGQEQTQGGMSGMILASPGGSDSGGTGGTGGLGRAGSASAGSGGSAGQDLQPPVPPSCDDFDGAVTNDDNGHCYRVNSSELTFAEARDACTTDGGHLVTITSEAEDTFIHGLLELPHWIGATDGRGNNMPGVGTYTWVNGDEWDYANWDDGQPNAVATNCPSETGGSHCFEHCAYQTETGRWIDRACWHTIASLCEWELPSTDSPAK